MASLLFKKTTTKNPILSVFQINDCPTRALAELGHLTSSATLFGSCPNSNTATISGCLALSLPILYALIYGVTHSLKNVSYIILKNKR